MTAFDYMCLPSSASPCWSACFAVPLREVMSIASWVASFLIALHFAPTLAKLLTRFAGAVVVAAVHGFRGAHDRQPVAVWSAHVHLTRLIRGSGLSPLDRGLGVLFGLVRAFVILVALMLIAGLTPLPREPAWRNGVLRPPLEALAKNVLRVSCPEPVARAHPLLVRPFN